MYPNSVDDVGTGGDGGGEHARQVDLHWLTLDYFATTNYPFFSEKKIYIYD